MPSRGLPLSGPSSLESLSFGVGVVWLQSQSVGVSSRARSIDQTKSACAQTASSGRGREAVCVENEHKRKQTGLPRPLCSPSPWESPLQNYRHSVPHGHPSKMPQPSSRADHNWGTSCLSASSAPLGARDSFGEIVAETRARASMELPVPDSSDANFGLNDDVRDSAQTPCIDIACAKKK